MLVNKSTIVRMTSKPLEDVRSNFNNEIKYIDFLKDCTYAMTV